MRPRKPPNANGRSRFPRAARKACFCRNLHERRGISAILAFRRLHKPTVFRALDMSLAYIRPISVQPPGLPEYRCESLSDREVGPANHTSAVAANLAER